MASTVQSNNTPSPELERELEKGSLPELPPNQPKGLLGERGFDLRKVDEFEPDLNSGVSQENDGPVWWMAILVAYFVFFPLAYYLLWRSQYFTVKAKWIISALFSVGILVVAYALVSN